MMKLGNTLYLTKSEAATFCFRHDLAPVRRISVAGYNHLVESTLKALVACYGKESLDYQKDLGDIQIVSTPGGGFRYAGAMKQTSSDAAQLSLFLPDADMYPGHLPEGEFDNSDLPFAGHGTSA